MFDIGWTELVVVAVVAILVVGPKDLPGMLRGFGQLMRSMRTMARDFRKQFDEALKEAELDEVRNIGKSSAFKPLEDARKSMEAYQKQVSDAIRGDAVTGQKSPSPAPAKEAATGAAKKAKSAPAKSKPKTKPAAGTSSKKPAAAKAPAKKPAAAKAPAKTAAGKPKDPGAAKPRKAAAPRKRKTGDA